MQAGISTASFYPFLIEDSIMHMAKNNIENIEIFFNTFSEIKKDYLKELSKIIKDNNQKVISIHPFTCGFEPFMLFTNYDRRLNDGLEFHKKYFEAMNILNAKYFVFHGDRKQGLIEDEESFERFAKLRDLGKEYNIVVAQENVERCRSGNLSYLKKMIKYLDNDVAIVFDNKQAFRSNITEEEFINAVGKNIVHMHISDRDENYECIALGNGNIDVKNILKQLKKVNFNGCIIIELYKERLNYLDEIYKSYKNLSLSI